MSKEVVKLYSIVREVESNAHKRANINISSHVHNQKAIVDGIDYFEINSIDELTDILETRKELLEEFIVVWNDNSINTMVYENFSIGYLCYILASEKGGKDRVSHFLSSVGISSEQGLEPVADKILKSYREAKSRL